MRIPERTRIWRRPGARARAQNGVRYPPCLTINGACPRGLDSRIPSRGLPSPPTHRLSCPILRQLRQSGTAVPYVTLCGLNRRFFYFTGPTKRRRRRRVIQGWCASGKRILETAEPVILASRVCGSLRPRISSSPSLSFSFLSFFLPFLSEDGDRESLREPREARV